MGHLHKKVILIVSTAVLLSGCAIQAQFNLAYTEPTSTQIRNEIKVSDNFENTWKKLVGEMSKSFLLSPSLLPLCHNCAKC
jgi:hypothetical protein